MYQRKYALEIISETGLGAIKLAITPIDYNTKLTTKECDDIIKTNKLETITEDKEIENHSLSKVDRKATLYYYNSTKYCFQCSNSQSISSES